MRRPRCDDAPSLVEVSTWASSPRYYGVGSSPHPGDFTANALELLPEPTLEPAGRQLLRLCAFDVPRFRRARLVRVGTFLEIAQRYPQMGGSVFEVRKEVTSPGWDFVNGNVAFAVRIVKSPPQPRNIPDSRPPVRGSTDVYALDPALLYVPDAGGGIGATYVPPMGGVPPGRGPGDLHIWHDASRYPHRNHTPFMDLAIDGPARVAMWAMVFQTNPMARGPHVLPEGFDVAQLQPEEGFLQSASLAKYSRVAGSMTYEDMPSEGYAHTLYSDRPETLLERLTTFLSRKDGCP